jgi:hypothetical protein
MIDTLPPQLPEEIAAARRRRDEAASERWPVIIGVVGTALVHLLLLLVVATIPPGSGDAVVIDDVESMRAKYDKQELTFMLADETPPPRPMRFVEVNPDAPENDPGNTNNFGARNQQSAQPVPGKEHNDRPMTKGELEDSTAVVTGSREQPSEAVAPPGTNGRNGTGLQAVVSGAPAQPKAEAPLPGLEKITGDNPDGLGTSIGKSLGSMTDADKNQEGKKDGPDQAQRTIAVNGGGAPGMPGRPTPRPRPKVQNVRPAVLADQPLSTDNMGVYAVDSRFNAYGEYLQELIDTVDAQFQKLTGEMTTYPPAHTMVTIRFKLNSKGEIAEIVQIDGEEKVGRVGTYTALDSIRSRAPYHPWTKEMVAVLGDETELIFSFLYR